jgi:hypothetical protein
MHGLYVDRTPVWNEAFVFEVYDPQLEQLHVEIKDKNFTARYG